MKIWTEDESIDVDTYNLADLESAMVFEANNIKAKADPEIFRAVADALHDLRVIRGLVNNNYDNEVCGATGLPCSRCQPCCNSRKALS